MSECVSRDELLSALHEADGYLSLIGYRYADRVRSLGEQFPRTDDLPGELIAASNRCRVLAKRIENGESVTAREDEE